MAGDEMRQIGELIIDAIEQRGEAAARERIAARVAELTARFPVPGLARPEPGPGAPAA
jgi:glycine/serine hydroxymethyltransferase